MRPFLWQEDGGSEFRTFLHLLESNLPLAEASNLALFDTAIRLYYASDGIIAYVMKLIRYGSYLALKQNQSKLNLHLLALAFDKSVRADKPEKINPFISDKFEKLEILSPQQDCEVGATSKRIKSKSLASKSNQVLKTT